MIAKATPSTRTSCRYLAALLTLGCTGGTAGTSETTSSRDAERHDASDDGGRDAHTDARADAATDAGRFGPDAPTCGNGTCDPEESAASCELDCTPCSPLGASATDVERMLVSMEADTWLELPDTSMTAVCPDHPVLVGRNCARVVSAWSSGTYDTSHNRMLVWGGGHDDYHGNEVYAFEVPTARWTRLTEPTTTEHLDRDPLGDGNPVSRHTYEGLEYVPSLDAMWAFGGSRARDGRKTLETWLLDLPSLTWEHHGRGPDGLTDGIGVASAYDPMTHEILVRTRGRIAAYDPETREWSTLAEIGYPPLWPRYAGGIDTTASIDPIRRLLWVMGSGTIVVWDIDAQEFVTDDWVTTGGGTYSNAERIGDHTEQIFESGGGDVYNPVGPGVDYDPVADALVAWVDDGGPYVLDLTTRAWTRRSGDGAPVRRTAGGTYGRWRYLPAYNVFILVNSAEENVRFYKHTRCP